MCIKSTHPGTIRSRSSSAIVHSSRLEQDLQQGINDHELMHRGIVVACVTSPWYPCAHNSSVQMTKKKRYTLGRGMYSVPKCSPGIHEGVIHLERRRALAAQQCRPRQPLCSVYPDDVLRVLLGADLKTWQSAESVEFSSPTVPRRSSAPATERCTCPTRRTRRRTRGVLRVHEFPAVDIRR